MNGYEYLLHLAIILLSTKVLGIITRRVQMPQVVGALLAGLLLGPAVFGILTETNFIHEVAEIGVIVLMFTAGMETDIDELKKSGKSSFIIALCGVIVPWIGGFLVAAFFNKPGLIESEASSSIFLQNIFIGVILTATSVSITVETLKEIGKLKTRSGNAILGAAIIDDILGVIALTIVTSMADSSVKLSTVLIKIALFFVFSGIVGFIMYKLYQNWVDHAEKGMRRHAIIAFVFCLLMAYIAEEFFGVADITGAFIAGLIISHTNKNDFLQVKFDTLSYMLLSPVFFASIGLKVVLPELTGAVVAFSIILIIVAILSKMIGCGLGAKMCGYKNYQCRRIGVGMVSRGEVALIVASKGAALGLVSNSFLGPIVVVVVITTIITPILIKPVFKKIPENEIDPISPNETITSFYETANTYRGEQHYDKKN